MAMNESTTEWRLQGSHMKWVWMVVFFIVAVVGLGATKWETIELLLDNQGVGEQGASILAFVAGYTLPLTAGAAIIVFLALRGVFERMHPFAGCVLAGFVLVVAGEVAKALGLGLLPEYSATSTVGGPGQVRFLAWALGGYLNTYGWPLAVSALAIGTGAALHVDTFIRDASGTSP